MAGEPFAVLLGDDLIHPSVPLLREMLRVHERYGRIGDRARRRCARSEISAYGAHHRPRWSRRTWPSVRSVVEKPAADEAPSNLAAIGRYVFTPEIFDALRETKPGNGGEIQLTDAINLLAQEQAVYAFTFEQGRYDVGNKLDYLKATVELAIERDDVGPGVPRVARRLRAAQEAGVAAGSEHAPW